MFSRKGEVQVKKIIGGKKYDTSTAQELASWKSSRGVRDFYYYEETLYRKRTGEFFLHGVGNAASKYAKRIEMNTWSGGEEIVPLSYDAAQEWAESHLNADDYEKIFGEVSEDDEEKKVTTITLSASTLEKAKRLAGKEGVFLSELIERLVNEEASSQ